MLSPIETVGFKKCVMEAFDNKEFVANWERLRKQKLTGEKSMLLFINDIRDTV